jgi:hypothetical protein
MQLWRFLYTTKNSIKKAVTKTGCSLPNINKYVTTEGRDFSECLFKAKRECGFKDHQLLGSRQIPHIDLRKPAP